MERRIAIARTFVSKLVVDILDVQHRESILVFGGRASWHLLQRLLGNQARHAERPQGSPARCCRPQNSAMLFNTCATRMILAVALLAWLLPDTLVFIVGTAVCTSRAMTGCLHIAVEIAFVGITRRRMVAR